MSSRGISTYAFALVVVRLGRRFLLVQERKHGGGWYLPAGRVEPGETFAAAAARETLEESGVPVHVEGILRIEHSPHPDGSARLRVLFVARPADDTPPKEQADEHSVRARWVTLDEARALPLRGREVLEVLSAVERGAPIHPLAMLQPEGAPWR